MGERARLRYDPQAMAGFFDEYGQREWDRFDTAPGGRANLEIHRRFIAEFIEPGWRVLDVGAGPGRFTIELARIGMQVVVTDISEEQLRLNREHVVAAGLGGHVEQRVVADVVDLSALEDDAFDASVCLGGPLSYVLDRADDAVTELVRVTRPGGVLLVAVMSLLGAARTHLDGIVDLAERFGIDEAVHHVLETGELSGEMNQGHQMKVYRSHELTDLLERHGCETLALSAANYLTVRLDDLFDEATGEIRDAILDWEVRLAREPGVVDAGTHIIAAARTPAR